MKTGFKNLGCDNPFKTHLTPDGKIACQKMLNIFCSICEYSKWSKEKIENVVKEVNAYFEENFTYNQNLNFKEIMKLLGNDDYKYNENIRIEDITDSFVGISKLEEVVYSIYYVINISEDEYFDLLDNISVWKKTCC